MYISNEQLNIIIRQLVDQAISKEAELNAPVLDIISQLNGLKSKGVNLDEQYNKWVSIAVTNNDNATYAKANKLGLARLVYSLVKKQQKVGVKHKKVNINTPKMRETLLAMGLTDKQVNIVIHKACDFKSHHDKAEKASAYKKSCKIVGRKDDGSINIKAKRSNRNPFNNEEYTQENVEAFATRQMVTRKNLRADVAQRIAKKSDLDKLDLSHGTHYTVMNAEFPKHVRGKTKAYNKAQKPDGWYKSGQMSGE